MKADRHRKEEGFAATDQNKADRAACMYACLCVGVREVSAVACREHRAEQKPNEQCQR